MAKVLSFVNKTEEDFTKLCEGKVTEIKLLIQAYKRNVSTFEPDQELDFESVNKALKVFESLLTTAFLSLRSALEDKFRESLEASSSKSSRICSCKLSDTEFKEIIESSSIIVEKGELKEPCNKCNKIISKEAISEHLSKLEIKAIKSLGISSKLLKCTKCQSMGSIFLPCDHSICTDCVKKSAALKANKIIVKSAENFKEISFDCPICLNSIDLSHARRFFDNPIHFVNLMRTISLSNMYKKGEDVEIEYCCASCFSNFKEEEGKSKEIAYCPDCSIVFTYNCITIGNK